MSKQAKKTPAELLLDKLRNKTEKDERKEKSIQRFLDFLDGGKATDGKHKTEKDEREENAIQSLLADISKDDKQGKNILCLDSQEAIDFFLKSEQYHGFELPEYFDFDEMLQTVKEKIGDTPYEDCLKEGVSPENLSDVNLDILLNKDGRYAVRPIILANPYLYYFLVRKLCDEKGWPIVKDLFEKFTVPHITSCALPIIPKKREPFHKSTTIINWWNSMEQRSIELSLEYRYMFVTDITNCYGSVNPQSFDWAFDLKGTQHERACAQPMAKHIQTLLCAFQQGRNIGIPQGSAIFDFVGEIILGYSDLLLHEALQAKAKEYEERGKHFPAYEIIRYRDDYRIFCNDKDALEDISYTLQHVLERLNFHMNSKKTMTSESIVTDSIKPDKLAYIYNTPIFNKKGVDFDSFEKHLLYILMFARKFPDSGSIKTMLSDIDKRIEKWLEPQEVVVEAVIHPDTSIEKPDEERTETFHRPLVGGSVRAMAAVCAQIALENVGCCHYALRVLSRMVDSLEDEQEKWDIINKVYAKLCNQPNSDYNQLWLQNITYQQDKKNGTSPYTMRLCRVVAGDDSVVLWNNDWLKPAQSASDSQASSVVNADTLAQTTMVVTFRETRLYEEIEEAQAFLLEHQKKS